MEVGAFSREARQHLYPSRYKTALAFSILPYPQPRGLTLRFAFPRQRTRLWENYGLTTFRVSARVG
jgi:hypothetical protein